jgi:hypothetical protein
MTNANRDLVFFLSLYCVCCLPMEKEGGKWACALEEPSSQGRWIVRDIVTFP